MSEETTGKIAAIVRMVTTVAAGFAGSAVLLFFTGSMAQKAQYDAAGLPFASIDYWAYVEIGAMGLIRTASLILLRPWPLFVLLGVTVGLMLLMESRRFRRHLAQPVLLLLACLILWLCIGRLVQQQMKICQLAEPSAGIDGALQRTRCQNGDFDVMFPFGLGMAPQMSCPTELDERFWEHSYKDLWEQFGADLQKSLADEKYVSLRPVPVWAHLANNTQFTIFGGKPESTVQRRRAMPQERTESLYRRTALGGVASAWAFVLLAIWERQLRNRFLVQREDVRRVWIIRVFLRMVGGFARFIRKLLPLREEQDKHGEHDPDILERLREEMWAAVRYVFLPVAGLMLAFSSFVLAPETFGILAMPRVGQELVEVIAENKAARPDKDGQPGSNPAIKLLGADGNKLLVQVVTENKSAGPEEKKPDLNLKGSAGKKLTEELAEISYHFATADGASQQEFKDKWDDKIEEIAASSDDERYDFLVRIQGMTRYYASDLSDSAGRKVAYLRGHMAFSTPGLVLFYPRSPEEKHLRLLLPNDGRDISTWDIVPIPLDTIKEVRAIRDDKTRRLIGYAKDMTREQEDLRASIRIAQELMGHWALLEASLISTFDPDPNIAGAAITSVGKYGGALGVDDFSSARRRRAMQILSHHIGNFQMRADIRGAAATSIRRLIRTDSERSLVANTLMNCITAEAWRNADPDFSVYGTAMTSLGYLQYKPAAGVLAPVLTMTNYPLKTRASIPSQLLKIDDKQSSVPLLIDYIASSTSEPEVLGTALTALGYLGNGSRTSVVPALASFIERVPGDPRYTGNVELQEHHIGSALVAISLANQPLAFRVYQDVLRRKDFYHANHLDDVVDTACMLLGNNESGGVHTEKLLLDVARDEALDDAVRARAVVALGNYNDERSIEQLKSLYQSSGFLIREAIKSALERRQRSGSSSAGFALSKLSKLQLEDDDLLKLLKGLKGDATVGPEKSGPASSESRGQDRLLEEIESPSEQIDRQAPAPSRNFPRSKKPSNSQSPEI